MNEQKISLETLQQLRNAIHDILPGAEIDLDFNSQVIIHTNKFCLADNTLTDEMP
jgi:hypothetical protein